MFFDELVFLKGGFAVAEDLEVVPFWENLLLNALWTREAFRKPSLVSLKYISMSLRTVDSGDGGAYDDISFNREYSRLIQPICDCMMNPGMPEMISWKISTALLSTPGAPWSTSSFFMKFIQRSGALEPCTVEECGMIHPDKILELRGSAKQSISSLKEENDVFYGVIKLKNVNIQGNCDLKEPIGALFHFLSLQSIWIQTFFVKNDTHEPFRAQTGNCKPAESFDRQKKVPMVVGVIYFSNWKKLNPIDERTRSCGQIPHDPLIVGFLSFQGQFAIQPFTIRLW